MDASGTVQNKKIFDKLSVDIKKSLKKFYKSSLEGILGKDSIRENPKLVDEYVDSSYEALIATIYNQNELNETYLQTIKEMADNMSLEEVDSLLSELTGLIF